MRSQRTSIKAPLLSRLFINFCISTNLSNVLLRETTLSNSILSQTYSNKLNHVDLWPRLCFHGFWATGTISLALRSTTLIQYLITVLTSASFSQTARNRLQRRPCLSRIPQHHFQRWRQRYLQRPRRREGFRRRNLFRPGSQYPFQKPHAERETTFADGYQGWWYYYVWRAAGICEYEREWSGEAGGWWLLLWWCFGVWMVSDVMYLFV